MSPGILARLSIVLTVSIVLFGAAASAHAWDEEGHVVVTRLAFQALPTSMPAWIRTPEVQARLEYLSAEPDRWRGVNSIQVDHINKPDHYIDLEMLEPYGMTIDTMPRLRRQFTDALTEFRLKHPEVAKDYDASRDPEYVYRVPGLLPYSIAELHWKVVSSWSTLKTMEANRSAVTDDMIRNARENIVYHMGILSHFVGDGAQPLHLTIHHNGWVGDNPRGFGTSKRFHSYIDGGVLVRHGFNRDHLPGPAKPPAKVRHDLYWEDMATYLKAGHAQMVPLYEMEKSGDLQKEPGKALIRDRLVEGGSMLAGMWVCAWETPTSDTFLDNKLKRKPGVRFGGASATTAPAPVSTSQPASGGE